MARRHETTGAHVAGILRHVILPNWKILFLVPVIALVAWLAWYGGSRPIMAQHAVILRFSPIASRFHADRIAVTIRKVDGTVTDLFPLARDVASCRAGDFVDYTSGPSGPTIQRCGRTPLEIRN